MSRAILPMPPMNPISPTPPFQVREDGRGWTEGPVKTVGRVIRPDPAEALSWNASMLRLSPLYGRWFTPGVYKFKTWNEERRWTQTQINQALQRPK
jgi:hypothetical protein